MTRTHGDVLLARRSRYGDRQALRRLLARHADRIGLLATVLGRTEDEASFLARQGLVLALAERGRFDDALVRSFGRVAASLPDPLESQGKLALLLVEVEGRPARDSAALLGVSQEQLSLAMAVAKGAYTDRTCRGWGLASGRAGLTEAEKSAGAGHLDLCRRCRDRRAAVQRVRAHVLTGSAGVVGAVAGAQLLPALLTGKAVAGLVAAAGAAVLVTGSAAAVADHARSHPPAPRHAPVVRTTPTAAPLSSHDPPRTATPGAPAPRNETVPPSAAPSTAPTAVPKLPVPSVPVVPRLPVLPSLPQLPPLLPLPLASDLHGLLRS